MSKPSHEAPRIFPAYRYRDASAAIDFLCRAFGFEAHATHMDGDRVVHAELAFGSSMIMLGTSPATAPKSDPLAMTIYVAVDDPDALFERARAAGATILEPPVDRDYGSREFRCADPEGHSWSFGTYWPKVGEAHRR
jgi:uncharacterized glyoxalase superfamily protein PhnB